MRSRRSCSSRTTSSCRSGARTGRSCSRARSAACSATPTPSRCSRCLRACRATTSTSSVSAKFTYLVTCQIYDRLKTSPSPRDQWKAAAIDELLARFKRSLKVAYVEHDEAKGVYSSVLLGAETLFGVDPSTADVGRRAALQDPAAGRPDHRRGQARGRTAITFATASTCRRST